MRRIRLPSLGGQHWPFYRVQATPGSPSPWNNPFSGKKMPCGANGSNDLRCDSLLEVSTLKKPFNGKKMSCGLKGSDALLLKHRDSPLEVGTLNKSFEGKKMSCGLKGSDALLLKHRDSPLEVGTLNKSFEGKKMSCGLKGSDALLLKHRDSPLEVGTLNKSFEGKKIPRGPKGSDDLWLKNRDSPLEASSWKKSFNGLLFGNSIIDETLLRSSTVTPKFLPSKYSVGRDGSNDVVIEGKSSDTTRKMSSVSSGLGPLLQQGRSATVLKSMPSFIFRRRFCNAAGDFSNSEANGASTKITLGNSKVLLAKITDAKAKWSSRLQVSRLKRMYSRSVRHEFLSRFLIAPGALHHKSTEFLSFQSYLMNNRDPQYITSFELMIRKTGFNTEEEWICFRNHLIETRTFIVEDWQSTSNVGNIETLYYDYGIKDTPGAEFMKGESDASFQEGSKKANLSVIIWKGNRVIWAEVFRDVDCPISIAAEAYAALALLFKCIELGYLNVVFYTDCRAIKEAISGLLTIRQGNPDNELLLLLRCIQSEFDRLIPIWKPRELNFLADDLASRNSTHCLQEALKKWSHHLSGKPLFKISQAPEANDIINKFVFREYNKPEESKYFMVVDQDKKIDALLQITETLCPRNLYVTIDGFGDKPQEFQMRIKELFGDKHASGVKGCLLLSTMVNAHADRNLLVALDTTVPEIIHAHKGIFTVILASPEERALLPKGIKELNALGYVYFHGVRKVNICKKEQLKWKVWKQQLTTAKKQHGKR